MNESGLKAAQKYDGVEYWLSDWQTPSMTNRKYVINAAHRFYKQASCTWPACARDLCT